MSLSSVRGAIIGAGIVVSSLVPTAGAEQVRARTGERVELCVPMAPEDGSGRVSISMRLERMLPDDRGCKVDIRVNNGMGAKDILSTEVPLGQYSYVNVFGPEGAKKDKTITGACTRD